MTTTPNIKGFHVHINDVFDISQEQLTPEGRTAVNNDIRAETSEIVLAKRIQYAFKDGNGARFWENFFPCDSIHRKQGYAIVYVLTKQQLLLLKEWWKQMMDGPDQTVKDNLTNSMKKFFRSNPKYDTLKVGFKTKILDPIYVYYMDTKIKAKNVELTRLGLYLSPVYEKSSKIVDFFNSDISVNNVEKIERGEYIDVLHAMILLVKQKVEEIVNKNYSIRYKSTENWPHYLSQVYIDKKWITNCSKIDPNCPLVKVCS
jgi:hypothetical protein